MTDISFHDLHSTWTFYLHLHDNREWNLESYKKIISFYRAEDAILLNDEIHYDLIKKSMMFLMKEDIHPMWEDPKNKDGGCFSFKVSNRDIETVWKHVYFHILGSSIMKNKENIQYINGITLSPKKKFCILKIWMNNCHLKDPNIFIDIPDLSREGCLFKKHCPEF
jgi:hypothetical protein